MMSRLPLLTLLMIGLSSGAPIYEEQVPSILYSSVVLPCKFHFVGSLPRFTVIWVKIEGRKEFVIWKFRNGEEKLEEQNPRYRGRVEVSNGVLHGHLDLTLRNITYEDEGTYECRAANIRRNGNKKVTLSIDNLNARDTTATMVTVHGKRHLKCQGSGDYHHPQVQWTSSEGEDLSQYGTFKVTEQTNGWKLVESVLDRDLGPNVQVWCHIKEGRLKRSTRAIISDGTRPVILDDNK